MNSDLRQPETQTGYEQIQQGGKEAEGGAKRAARAPEATQEGQGDEKKDGARKKGKKDEKEKAGQRKEGAGPGGLCARGWVAMAARRCQRCP